MAYADQRAPSFANQQDAPPVTVESLLTHYRQHGLENSHSGYRGREQRYTTYAAARKDALIHVARTFLSEDAYVHLLEAIKYGQWPDQARADWRGLHEAD